MLSPELEFTSLCEPCGLRDLYDLGKLMVRQGCRPEELRALAQSDVDLEYGTLTIRWGKSDAAKRTLRLTAISREILARRLQTPGRWVFPSSKNPGEHIGVHQRLHEAVLKRAQVSFVPYDFRHTFATRAIERGVDLPTLAAIMGHANLRSIGKYVHISRQQMDVGMARFEAAEGLPGSCPVGTGQKGENEGFSGKLREGSGNAQVQ